MIFIAIFFGIAVFIKIMTIIWDNFMKENFEKSMKANKILFNKYFVGKGKKLNNNPILANKLNMGYLKGQISSKLNLKLIKKKDI